MSTLLNGLQAYYKLEDLTDSSGHGLTLTNNGAVTFTAGKVGNAANFASASNQWLSHADNAAFQMGTGDITVAAWLKFTANESADLVIYGNPLGGAILGYGLVSASQHIGCCIGDGTHAHEKEGEATFNDGVWHLAIATFDRAGNASIYVDNGTPATVSITDVTGSVNHTGGLAIGGGVGGSHLSNSSIDEVGIWNRVLTSAERTALWNSGNGVTYPFGVIVDLTGVAASPVIGTGTVEISEAPVPPFIPPITVAGQPFRVRLPRRRPPHIYTHIKRGVVARAATGKFQINAVTSVESPPHELIMPDPYGVFNVALTGFVESPVVSLGKGAINITADLLDEEIIALINE
jgi:hypothetical protein